MSDCTIIFVLFFKTEEITSFSILYFLKGSLCTRTLLNLPMFWSDASCVTSHSIMSKL